MGIYIENFCLKELHYMKFGYHSVYEKSYYEAIDRAVSFGFDYVQPDLNVPAFFLDGLSETELLKIQDYAKNAGVALSLHAPGDNISLFSDYPLIRKGILSQFELILEKADLLGARHLTIHAGAAPGFKKAAAAADEYALTMAEHYSKVLYENISRLLSRRGGVLICLENHRLNNVIMEVADRLLPELKLTLDTAKVYNGEYRLDRELFGYMLSRSEHIRELHINDVIPGLGSHQVFGKGLVNFMPYLELMRREDVWLTFEVRPVEAAASAMAALRIFCENASGN
jgi:sugar phosphate isomerase/epimerase